MAGQYQTKNAYAAAKRAYSGAHFALELDTPSGKDVGLIRSIDGGGLKVEALTYQSGGNSDILRQLGKPKFEDIKVQVGMAMSAPFYAWLAEFMRGNVVRMNGAVVAADFYYQERARREFKDALITELSFPALDGASKSSIHMSVTMSPESIAYEKGKNAKLQVAEDESGQKLWTGSNFEFVIYGMTEATLRTTKVDGFTIRQKAIEYHSGSMRAPLKVPGRIEMPNISFYIPEADAAPLIEHVTKRGIKGEVPAGNPLSGHLETFDNEGHPLFRFEFSGADIINLAPDKSDAGSDQIKQVKVEMSIEKIEFKYINGG